eukprot:CAMPEP_0171328736 /NCGR_PEP_ID=MMETSP0878-20121228/822_1 /TAXON_ID=67004 /ORGANISM="Thalassiosira weissflogii, Strain CCMP1336" /LENGTH=260 /DNA_ID=CAMNT_0011828605 /DNA_START=95 /DNA_END=877 /DNA_ORIENTATION=-
MNSNSGVAAVTQSRILVVALWFSLLLPCASFSPTSQFLRNTRIASNYRSTFPSTHLLAQKNNIRNAKDKEVTTNSNNPLELASWYAVEAFGKVFGGNIKDDNKSINNFGVIDLTKPPSSLDETLTRIQMDNDRSYFLSGEVDRLIYDEDCTFADPFVSFNGRDRFIENLANLGSFITNYDARMLKYDVEKDGKEIVTKVMVKLELNLPWKPVLAWPWGVTYKIDPETCLVTSHIESWDIDALDGVLQIFRKPTVKIGNKE